MSYYYSALARPIEVIVPYVKLWGHILPRRIKEPRQAGFSSCFVVQRCRT